MAEGDSLRTLEVKAGDPVSAARENDLVRRVANLSLEIPAERRAAPGTTANLPFQVSSSSALGVTIQGGTLFWQNSDVIFATSSEIAVPINSTAFLVWLDLGSSFSASVTSGSGAAGWSGYSAQPNPPARRYLLLASIASNDTAITAITLRYHGGDIFWPTVYAFWA